LQPLQILTVPRGVYPSPWAGVSSGLAGIPRDVPAYSTNIRSRRRALAAPSARSHQQHPRRECDWAMPVRGRASPVRASYARRNRPGTICPNKGPANCRQLQFRLATGRWRGAGTGGTGAGRARPTTFCLARQQPSEPTFAASKRRRCASAELRSHSSGYCCEIIASKFCVCPLTNSLLRDCSLRVSGPVQKTRH
jgi:hypothetical protein